MDETKSSLLRIYCVSGDHLHDAIVDAARRANLCGASVRKAKMGFSRNGHFFSDLLSEVEIEEQPIVLEIIDTVTRIEKFLPVLHSLVQGRRLVTIESIDTINS